MTALVYTAFLGGASLGVQGNTWRILDTDDVSPLDIPYAPHPGGVDQLYTQSILPLVTTECINELADQLGGLSYTSGLPATVQG